MIVYLCIHLPSYSSFVATSHGIHAQATIFICTIHNVSTHLDTLFVSKRMRA